MLREGRPGSSPGERTMPFEPAFTSLLYGPVAQFDSERGLLVRGGLLASRLDFGSRARWSDSSPRNPDR